MRRSTPFLIQAINGLLLSLLMAGSLFADAGDPPARVARISFLAGTVSLQPSGASEWSQASLNYPVTTGDRIYTDQNGRAELEAGPATVRASATTDLTIATLNDRFMQLGLGQGAIRVRVYELLSGDSVEIDTPNGALLLQQPGDYRVETYPDNGTTFVIVNNGVLEVRGGAVLEKVGSGHAVKLTGTDPINVAFMSMPASDAFDQWVWERDRRVAASASAQYVGRGTPGYADLDVYGTWDEHPKYGHVWYPTGVSRDWVPYRHGHWVWIEPWGWTWVENEPWGFAPFHYGRWVYVGVRWAWVPGVVVARPYYAPALVAFVGGPNFAIGIGVGGGVQGWFPLGPGEPFRPWYHHSEPYRRQVNITHVTNITYVNNVTNIQYVNQPGGTTVVSTDAFRRGQPVDREMIRVKPGQLGRAQVMSGPETTPPAGALGGGRAVPSPIRTPTPTMGVKPQGSSGSYQRFGLSAPKTSSPTERGSQSVKFPSGPSRTPVITNTPVQRGSGVSTPRTSPGVVTRAPSSPQGSVSGGRQVDQPRVERNTGQARDKGAAPRLQKSQEKAPRENSKSRGGHEKK